MTEKVRWLLSPKSCAARERIGKWVYEELVIPSSWKEAVFVKAVKHSRSVTSLAAQLVQLTVRQLLYCNGNVVHVVLSFGLKCLSVKKDRKNTRWKRGKCDSNDLCGLCRENKCCWSQRNCKGHQRPILVLRSCVPDLSMMCWQSVSVFFKHRVRI